MDLHPDWSKIALAELSYEFKKICLYLGIRFCPNSLLPKFDQISIFFNGTNSM